jgi:hypothetical protein
VVPRCLENLCTPAVKHFSFLKECDFDLCNGFAGGKPDLSIFVTSNQCIALKTHSLTLVLPCPVRLNITAVLRDLVLFRVFCVVRVEHNFYWASYKPNTNSG